MQDKNKEKRILELEKKIDQLETDVKYFKSMALNPANIVLRRRLMFLAGR